MNNVYIEDGLIKFNLLKKDKLSVLCTYDNSIWGNMNPVKARNDEERSEITKKDNKISYLQHTKLNFVLSTPPENTLCHLNDSVFQQLSNTMKKEDNSDAYTLLRSNSVFTKTRNEKISFFVAPADCPVLAITNKGRDFVIVIHLGLPQYVQDLHVDTILLAKNYLDLNQELDVFVTPYICSRHYLIADEKYQKILENKGVAFEKYAKKVYSEIYKEERWSIDIQAIIKDEISHLLPNSNIIESGMCTYEEVEKGNLFSHKYATDMKQLEKDYFEGNFNVIVSI